MQFLKTYSFLSLFAFVRYVCSVEQMPEALNIDNTAIFSSINLPNPRTFIDGGIWLGVNSTAWRNEIVKVSLVLKPGTAPQIKDGSLALVNGLYDLSDEKTARFQGTLIAGDSSWMSGNCGAKKGEWCLQPPRGWRSTDHSTIEPMNHGSEAEGRIVKGKDRVEMTWLRMSSRIGLGDWIQTFQVRNETGSIDGAPLTNILPGSKITLYVDFIDVTLLAKYYFAYESRFNTEITYTGAGLGTVDSVIYEDITVRLREADIDFGKWYVQSKSLWASTVTTSDEGRTWKIEKIVRPAMRY